MGEVMRTYWLSFCDDQRPQGQQFLGVVIVDVSEVDAAGALLTWDATHATPMADRVDGPWLAAAMRACWRAGVNPGGEVASRRIDDAPGFPRMSPRYPRLQLLSRDEIAAFRGFADEAPTPSPGATTAWCAMVAIDVAPFLPVAHAIARLVIALGQQLREVLPALPAVIAVAATVLHALATAREQRATA
jgi:hypothetical protein